MTAVKPNICVDFDGVLNTYTGWQGEDELFEPRLGVRTFLEVLHLKYTIIIFSTRDNDKIWEWLREHNLNQYINQVTSTKVGAVAYVDDRAVRFNGDYGEVVKELIGFKAHWEKED